ncbi:hypothetical protein [Actinoplanes sp. NPDC026670]|uniref:hypothetical protein n=1 Tax=Actinoplanes sp. NPDC026670 TaxID=3154700 RepID=UPI0033CDA70E
MFSGLHDVDWASMHHAYGSAEEVPTLLEALRSPDAGERGRALDDFYGKVHHQGDVYASTTASLPFLLELAADPATPDRHQAVRLLVSIGEEAVDREDGFDYEGSDFGGARAFVRAHAGAFAGFAADPVCLVRQAAIPALGLFLDDADRALGLLQERAAMDFCLRERLLATKTAAVLARRHPAIRPAVASWLAALAAAPVGSVVRPEGVTTSPTSPQVSPTVPQVSPAVSAVPAVPAVPAMLTTSSAVPAVEPEFRLAALIHRAQCEPEAIGDDLVSAVVGLLREVAAAMPPEQPWPEPPPVAPPAEGVPPFVAAAFEELDRISLRHSITTDLLKTLHELLGARLPERHLVLTEQLSSPDPGTRLDAIRMTGDLLRSWRGDHSALIRLVAVQVGAANLEVAAQAASLLEDHHRHAEPARADLAALIATHGPDGWSSPRRHLRRAYQKAVLTLARLGDERAVPSLVGALDGDVDVWLAVPALGGFPQVADLVVPRLHDRLRRADLSGATWSAASGILATLARLGDTTALPLISDTLATAAERENWDLAKSALAALRVFGSAAAPALAEVRRLVAVDDIWTRSAVITTLWEVGGDRAEVLPLALALLDTFALSDAADVLGAIGPAAAEALPRLRTMLTDGYDWNRVHAVAAIWDIGGEPEGPVVLETLMQAWRANQATKRHVVPCLLRMGTFAAPALAEIRAELTRPERDPWVIGPDDEELLLDIDGHLSPRSR